MTSSISDRIPAPLRRLVGFVLGGFVVYAAIVVVGAVLLPADVASGSNIRLAATLVAGAVAYYLVYFGGYDQLFDLLP